MALWNIFLNNLKTVSRNWVYLIILIVCPIILISVSGIMLNSVDYKNIPVGICNSDESYSFDNSYFNKVKIYPSLQDCIGDLSSSKTNICIHSYEGEEKYNVDVYIDNRKRMVEYYVKQFILEKFSEERFYFFQESSKDVETELALFSSSMESSKNEMYNAYYELEDQERKLQGYKQNLSVIRNDFDVIYYSLKEVEDEISDLKEDLNSETNSVSGNLSVIREKRTEIESNLYVLESYLVTRLPATDYSYVKNVMDAGINDLKEIETSLEAINDSYSDPEFVRAVNNLDTAIDQMDSIKFTLDNLDSDLENSIQSTRESKERIHLFIQNLNEGKMQIEELMERLSEKNVFIEFKKSFLFSEDPILISFPLLIAIITTFTSVVLSNIFILKQTGQKSYLRETLSPTKDFSFVLAGYLTNLFFIFIQVVTLILIGFYLFHGSFFENLGLIMLAIFLAVSVFILIGMIIGYLIKTESLSILLSLFSVILFFVFSDILAPTALTGPIINFLINLNPFVILNNILFDVILIKSEFYLIKEFFIKLLILFGIFSILTYISKKINKKRFFNHQ